MYRCWPRCEGIYHGEKGKLISIDRHIPEILNPIRQIHAITLLLPRARALFPGPVTPWLFYLFNLALWSYFMTLDYVALAILIAVALILFMA